MARRYLGFQVAERGDIARLSRAGTHAVPTGAAGLSAYSRVHMAVLIIEELTVGSGMAASQRRWLPSDGACTRAAPLTIPRVAFSTRTTWRLSWQKCSTSTVRVAYWTLGGDRRRARSRVGLAHGEPGHGGFGN